MKYGEQIRQERHRRNLTQAQLAALASVCPSMISKMEASESVRLDSLRRVLFALNMSVMIHPPIILA
tara:strand:- start:1037 stop:1237 length:201 start_codon:yes stop_codon:yes gene_type:complete